MCATVEIEGTSVSYCIYGEKFLVLKKRKNVRYVTYKHEKSENKQNNNSNCKLLECPKLEKSYFTLVYYMKSGKPIRKPFPTKKIKERGMKSDAKER